LVELADNSAGQVMAAAADAGRRIVARVANHFTPLVASLKS
jgi:hypothetical protein